MGIQLIAYHKRFHLSGQDARSLTTSCDGVRRDILRCIIIKITLLRLGTVSSSMKTSVDATFVPPMLNLNEDGSVGGPRDFSGLLSSNPELQEYILSDHWKVLCIHIYQVLNHLFSFPQFLWISTPNFSGRSILSLVSSI